MTIIRRDLGTPVTTGPAPDAGSRVDRGPLDVAAIEAWTDENLRGRHAYAVRKWQIRNAERKQVLRQKRKATS